MLTTATQITIQIGVLFSLISAYVAPAPPTATNENMILKNCMKRAFDRNP
jgi:hypothetical protein